MRQRILLFAATLILVPLLTYFVILITRGYRPTPGKPSLQPTGILAASSTPEGAELYINGEFKSATDTNLNLPPGQYKIAIKKDTYFPWEKTLEVAAEEVTRAQAILWPTVPSLKAITTSGAVRPTLSPDGTKVAFLSQSNLYTLDLTESPLGLLNRDPKLISNFKFQISNLIWSPDSKQILAQATGSATLIDVNQQSAKLVASPSGLLAQWNLLLESREALKFSTLPLQLQEILATSAANLVWSPNESKLLYTATASAIIPDELIKPLPGSSTQPQEREIKPGSVYVYDLEEDRNFRLYGVSPSGSGAAGTPHQKATERETPFKPSGLSWFPTSSHIIKVGQGAITILEYDGGNSTVVYSGPMEDGYALPYPSGKQLLILSNFSAARPSEARQGEARANLYAVSLR